MSIGINAMHLTLERANQIIAAALARSSALKLKPLSVAVLDAGGHLISLQRQDGCSSLRPEIAIAKASSALALGFSSRKIAELAAERPHFITAVGAIAPHGIIPAPGGVLITDSEGAVLGAIGISGDTSDNDEACGLTGIASTGFNALV